MNKLIKTTFLLTMAILIFQGCHQKSSPPLPELEPAEETKSPVDYLYNQRAYPHNQLHLESYQNGVQQTLTAKRQVIHRDDVAWELAGPVNIGGRITDVLLHPTDQNIIYVGASVGGIWKSEDQGLTWSPIFEEYGTLTIGHLAISASNPDILYAGTGEANGSATSGAFFGNGIYKSEDGGESWIHLGLEQSQHIGRIAVNPLDPNTVFVAAAGALYGKDDNRGLYRTTDGGDSWEKVLFVSDSTSVIDVVMDIAGPNVLYAATWERIRKPWGRTYGGLTSGIWRSLDNGDTWEELTNGLPNDDPGIGRIGLDVSKTTSGVVYAVYTTNPVTNTFQGIYKSENTGVSWQKMDDDPTVPGVFASFGWFFGNIRVSPSNDEKLWILGQILMESNNSGQQWDQIAQQNHVDNHGLEIHPENENFMVAGNDGGVYISQDGGENWSHVQTLPITQFYECEIDQSDPERLYAGAQDNGTMTTPTGAIDDWNRFLGGDGFHVLVNPVDNNYIYAEYQYGNLFRSYTGGDTYEFIYNGQDDRTNWNTPVVFDPSNPSTLYYGAHRLHRSTDDGYNWEIISPDLTDGPHPSGSLAFGTITAIAVAPSNPDYIYVGTDDGNIQVSTIGGTVFTNISDGVPDRYVTEIAVDDQDEDVVFATLSGYRYVDYQPHVLKSTNAGQDWEDISGDLPEIPVNDIILDPDRQDTYYIANDLGVWFTKNGGENWEVLDPSLPMTVVNDLDFHPDTRMLVAATFGRSMYKIDLTDLFVNELTVNSDPIQLNLSPNPATEGTLLTLDLPNPTEATIELFDITGKKITTVGQGQFSAGRQTISIDCSDLAGGKYVVRLFSEKTVLAKNLLVAR